MLGKPEWFKRRKYGGWGVFPRTWQGWVYVVVMFGLILGVQALPITEQAKTISLAAIALLFIADLVHIMAKLPMDERERLHDAIAERNALWAIIAALTIGVGYQAAVSVVKDSFAVDPVILIALGAGVVVKAVTNIYLDRKD